MSHGGRDRPSRKKWGKPGRRPRWQPTLLDLLGLDEVTLAAYRLWLRDERLTLEQVGVELGQPVRTVRRVRDRLVELSLLLASHDRPGEVVAVHPQVPLEHLLRAQHEQLIRRQEQLLGARTQVGTLVEDFLGGHGAARSNSDVERLDTVDAVRARLLTLTSTAEREVLTLVSRSGRPADLAEQLLPVELRALRRGVAMRKVVPRPTGFDPPDTGYHRTAAAYGVELRTTDDPGVDLTVVDGRVSVIVSAGAAAGPGGGAGFGLTVRAPVLTSLALSHFDQVWKLSEPLRATTDPADPGASGPDSVSELERSLLRLLSLGAKDEAAARQLGVSVRTVRRMVADVMRRLDARSRFQAGILAAQRGWL